MITLYIKSSVFVCVLILAKSTFALNSRLEKTRMLKKPIREISLIITSVGYYPSHISLFEGEQLKVFLTTTLDRPGCLILPEKKVYLSAQLGQISETVIDFKKAGLYKFYCPTEKISGRITVLKKLKKRKSRGLASFEKEKISGVKIWRPRDE